MRQFPIGIMLESLKMDSGDAIEKAARMGAKGLQIYSTYGEFAPENMTKQQKSDLKDRLRSNGLVISALCGDLGHGFRDRGENSALIEHSKKIIDHAKELGTNIVTTHIGVISGNPEHETYKIMQEACFVLSGYADSMGAHFAIETGPETALVLKKFLDSLGSRGVAVNLDPANLVMVAGDDPVQAVYHLKDYIVHTHAKDGRQFQQYEPETLYAMSLSARRSLNAYKELPLGEGDVDFKSYLKALEDVDYKGFLTIEREVGENPVKDIKTAIDFLNSHMEQKEIIRGEK